VSGKLNGNAAGPAGAGELARPDADVDVDVVVVGAGFSGLYLLTLLREAGFSARVIEAGDGVGGTWYWNRYPGARCDTPTTDYAYSFDPQLERDWHWSEKYATQPEILAYLDHVADRYGLRQEIQLSTRVTGAHWQEDSRNWLVRTDRGDTVSCRFVVMATGCLSQPKVPDIAGTDEFTGEVYFTSRWPHEPVDFTGKRVAVIGTGSSGIQVIPEIARQAASLTVFQRTPNYTSPAFNGPPPADRVAALTADRDGYRESARWSPGGLWGEFTTVRAADASAEVRRQRFEDAWASGELFKLGFVFIDQGINLEANEIVAEMIREKIRAIVADPRVAEDLSPRGYPYGAKRPCLGTGYYETFNLPRVRLVNLRRDPITAVTAAGVQTASEMFPVDAIVYAIGFDAMTGPLMAIDITGTRGQAIAQKWSSGPSTYLGLAVSGFPNLFMVTGPGSPSVLTNVPVSIEQHVEWIVHCLRDLRAGGFDRIEATAVAEEGWNRHVADCGALSLLPKANSWYLGVNVPGKPQVIAPYTGGVGVYRAACDEVVDRGYFGFELSGPGKSQRNDGILRPLQPDVAAVVRAVAGLGLPAIETMTVAEARKFARGAIAERPPGPAVAEVAHDIMPAPRGDLPYRIYRPRAPGPHPAVVYFHGGGWVLGDLDSDDPFCRDICVRSGCVVVSVDYRLAPEARFPAASADALAAVAWVAANPDKLGVIPGRIAVLGWSAGGNVAAVACQEARNLRSVSIAGQVLVCPVTDSDLTRASYRANGEGYILTTATMGWFWGHYADVDDRVDPRAAPLRGDLRGLPPAVVVTAEFDPLRDEGDAYADALAAAGVPVEHVRARGHIHSSVTMVDVVRSGEQVRDHIAGSLRAWLIPGESS
jgi:cation diffusion facilitator CzcD-associated flavoprotein CzcO/acetyl esterase/lipase